MAWTYSKPKKDAEKCEVSMLWLMFPPYLQFSNFSINLNLGVHWICSIKHSISDGIQIPKNSPCLGAVALVIIQKNSWHFPWNKPFIFCPKQGLVFMSRYVSHHPTTKNIFHLQQIFGWCPKSIKIHLLWWCETNPSKSHPKSPIVVVSPLVWDLGLLDFPNPKIPSKIPNLLGA